MVGEDDTVSASDDLAVAMTAANESEPPPARAVANDATGQATASAGATETAADTDSTDSVSIPMRIDRYVVTGELGRGGAGVVFRAHDDKLQRPVALKLLRPNGDTKREADSSRARLVREAHALAKLAHPNAVTVYDAGNHRGDVYIAMELVDGPTFRDWLRERDRDRRDILRILIEAGRGLAAAHAAGFVHRDFKPGNVLLGADGRPRVADFGLARALAGPDETAPDADAPPGDNLDASDTQRSTTRVDEVTEAGLIMGTPPYMAPEQLISGAVGPAADQYAFCLTAYEALAGRRPFRQKSVLAQARAKLAGDLPPLPAEVPAAIERAIARGLEPRPEDRWPSMNALLAELVRANAPRRWGWFAAAAVALLALGGGTALALSDSGPTCDGTARLDGVWNAQTRQSLVEGFREVERDFAATAAASVADGLDTYAEQWLDGYRDACEATHVRGEQSESRLDQRMRCLDDRLRNVAALTGQLAGHPDADVIALASAAVADLESPATCDGLIELPALSAAELAARVPAYRAVADADAAYMLGRYDRARTILAEHAAALGRLDDDPVSVAALALESELAAKAIDVARADELSRQALARATELKLASAAARVAVERFHLVGVLARQPERALGALATTEAMVALAAPDRTPRLRHSVGVVNALAGDYPGAIAEYRRALELGRQRGMNRVDLAIIDTSLGLALVELPNLDAARLHLERAHEVLIADLGTDHPLVSASWTNLGKLRAQLGDTAEEVIAYRRALAIDTKTHGPDHPHVAQSHANLGLALHDNGNVDEARTHAQRALEIRRAKLAPNDPAIAMSLRGLAEIARQEKRFEDAVAHYREALIVLEAGLGREHVQTGRLRWQLACALLEQKDGASALKALGAARPVLEKTVGPAHPDTIDALVREGIAQSLTGDESAARQALELAYVRAEEASLHPYDRAELEFLLANALWPNARDQVRAASLARSAHARLTTIAADQARDHVAAWMREHNLTTDDDAP